VLQEHLNYVSDRMRLELFQEAIAKAVKTGNSITDLGCGSGILGLLCLQAGAAKVYAIDSTAMIEIARETLSRAGYCGKAVFLRGHSYRIELPERVDVAICDHVGYFGFDYGIVQFFEDAKKRFLKPGGTLIPARIKLQLAVVESESSYGKAEEWRAENVPAEFHWLRHHGVNTKQAVNLKREELLGAPAELGSIDLREDNPDFFSWDAELRLERDGVMHGLGGWFECELAEGVWMTNSPVSDRRINRPQVFLPVGEAVEVKAGDVVKTTIMTRPADHLIAWTVKMPATGRQFSHSTWLGALLTPQEIVKRNPAHVPRLSRTGQARTIVLGFCDGRRTVKQIEEAVLREYPGLFPSAKEISRFVAQVLGVDSE
jgi:protein arginine N-methyltransferase 1